MKFSVMFDKEHTTSILLLGQYNSTGFPVEATTISVEEAARDFAAYRVGIAINYYLSPFIAIPGLVGNILAMIIMLQRHNRRLSCCVYLAGLTLCDTVTVMFSFMLWYITAIEDNDSNLECKVVAIGFQSGATCSSFLVVAVTVDRFLATCFPVKSIRLRTPKRAILAIISVSIISVIVSVPFLIMARFVTTDICTGFSVSNMLVVEIYSVVSIIMFSVLPFIVILVLNIAIIRTIAKRERSRANLNPTRDSRTGGELSSISESWNGEMAENTEHQGRATSQSELSTRTDMTDISWSTSGSPDNRSGADTILNAQPQGGTQGVASIRPPQTSPQTGSSSGHSRPNGDIRAASKITTDRSTDRKARQVCDKDTSSEADDTHEDSLGSIRTQSNSVGSANVTEPRAKAHTLTSTNPSENEHFQMEQTSIESSSSTSGSVPVVSISSTEEVPNAHPDNKNDCVGITPEVRPASVDGIPVDSQDVPVTNHLVRKRDSTQLLTASSVSIPRPQTLARSSSTGSVTSSVTQETRTGRQGLLSRIRSRSNSDHRKLERQLSKMLLTVSFTFLILTLPQYIRYAVYTFVDAGDDPTVYANYVLLYHITQKLYMLNNAMNFVLYSISGARFRRDLRSLFCKRAAQPQQPAPRQ